MQPENNSPTRRIEPETPESQVTVSAPINMSMDFRAQRQVMYVIPHDKLDRLEGDAETENSKFFGASLAVFLTLIGIIASGQITNVYIFGACVGCLFASGVMSYYFYREDRKDKRRRRQQFIEIREESRTVIALAPAESETSLRRPTVN